MFPALVLPDMAWIDGVLELGPSNPKLVAGFIREELQPRLDSGTERLSHLNSLLDSSHPADAAFLASRISKLGQWHARSKAVLPLLTGLLD